MDTNASFAPSARVKRRRVNKACDRCKERKRRCDGLQPCRLCQRNNAQCLYNGQLSGLFDLGIQSPRAERQIDSTIPQDRHRIRNSHEPHNQSPDRRNPTSLCDARIADEPSGIAQNSRAASPNAEGIAAQGQYLGPTSTFSFLRRASRRLGRFGTLVNETHDANVSIFASGDAQFPEQTDGMVSLPNQDVATALVSRYFDFAAPSHRFLHQPTIMSWVAQLNDRTELVRPVQHAVLLLVVATALLYKVDEHGNVTGAVDPVAESDAENLSEKYFQAAQTKLASERGLASLESVQARLAGVLYLLNTSRLNQAWYMLGVTHQLILALGYHRSRALTGSTPDCVAQECRKRCYWVCYTVDTYFSVMLGRPPLMSEQGVDQKYPELVNDENITAQTMRHGPVARDCVQAAPVCHAKLARIIREAANEQLGAYKFPLEPQVEAARRLNQQMDDWQQQLPVFLSGDIHPSSLIPIFRRQLRVLQMAANHATMMINRPFILTPHSNAELIKPLVNMCLAAAHKVLETVLELVEHNHLFRAFWNFQYITFHALSVVYVWICQRRHRMEAMRSEQQETILYDMAERVQAYLAEVTQKNAPNLRYSIILEELQQEARHALKKLDVQGQALDHVPAPAVEVLDEVREHELSIDSISEWTSVFDFPADAELWLALDSLPFDDMSTYQLDD